MISYQAFLESYSKTQKPLNEHYQDSGREEYDPSSDIPEEHSLSYQEGRSTEGLGHDPRYTNDNHEEINHSINLLNRGIKKTIDTKKYSPVNHSIEEINGLVSQKNLTPMHKARILMALHDHNNALNSTSGTKEPHEYATENQEMHLFGSDYDAKSATLPKLADLHDDYVRSENDRGMSETDRIFGSEAGYNRYKHG